MQPFEPYAAPRAVPPGPTPPAASGQAVPWEPGEVLGLAWTRFKRTWFVLVAGYVVTLVITQLASQGPALAMKLASEGADKTAAGILIGLGGSLASVALSTFFMVGMFRVWLESARGRSPVFGTLFLGGDRFLPMLGLYLLMTLAILGGFMLLVVPGFIFALGLSFAPFYLVDANLGPVEAMQASWAATKGQKGKLFVLGFLCTLTMMLGLLACGVGAFATISVAYVAWAVAYTRIAGRDVALPDPSPGMRG